MTSNEQIQQAIANLINKATVGAEQATEFLVSEIPDVVYQLMLWYGVKSFISFLFGVIGIIVIIIGGTKLFKWMRSERKNGAYWATNGDSCNSPSDAYALTMLFGPLVCAGPIAWLLDIFVTLEWLQILIAPKVWLIEYGMDLVK